MLIEFYGTECPHCRHMEPLVERLEREESVSVEKHETWHNDDNELLRQKYDKGLCGGVPFFIDSESGKYICGAVSYEDLKKWAKPVTQ